MGISDIRGLERQVGEDREPEPEAGLEAKPEARAKPRDTARERIIRAVLSENSAKLVGNGATGVLLMAENSVNGRSLRVDVSCGGAVPRTKLSCPKN